MQIKHLFYPKSNRMMRRKEDKKRFTPKKPYEIRIVVMIMCACIIALTLSSLVFSYLFDAVASLFGIELVALACGIAITYVFYHRICVNEYNILYAKYSKAAQKAQRLKSRIDDATEKAAEFESLNQIIHDSNKQVEEQAKIIELDKKLITNYQNLYVPTDNASVTDFVSEVFEMVLKDPDREKAFNAKEYYCNNVYRKIVKMKARDYYDRLRNAPEKGFPNNKIIVFNQISNEIANEFKKTVSEKPNDNSDDRLMRAKGTIKGPEKIGKLSTKPCMGDK